MRRFILNFTEIVKVITNMLRKENGIKWTIEDKHSFLDIKQDLSKAPMLISPNFSKYFLVFSFASEHTIAGV